MKYKMTTTTYVPMMKLFQKRLYLYIQCYQANLVEYKMAATIYAVNKCNHFNTGAVILEGKPHKPNFASL